MTNQGDDLYKILNLKQDCSNQEIKEAFIKLSKKYHPDINKDKGSHAAFLKVNQAYSILGKYETRKKYDISIDDSMRTYRQYYGDVYTTRPEKDSSFYSDSQFKGQVNNSDYYSIKGLKKVSNSVILGVCFFVAAVGIAIEYYALRKSLTFDREKLKHDSARNHLLWEVARNQALSNGNEQQIRNFQKNELKGGNLSVINALYAEKLKEEELKRKENLKDDTRRNY